MDVITAMRNALEFLESLGYKGGDIHDDLATAIEVVETTPAARMGVDF